MSCRSKTRAKMARFPLFSMGIEGHGDRRLGLSCCYAGKMHCLDAPFRLTTWANYIMPVLASPRVATVRAANKMRPRACENAWGRKLLCARRREASLRACASSCARTRGCTRFDRRRRCRWILPSTARMCEGGSLRRTAGCKAPRFRRSSSIPYRRTSPSGRPT